MGSYIFFAPEMFTRTKDSKVRGEMTDIWALGVTLYYMLCGKYPAQEATNLLELKEQITQKEVNFDFIKNNLPKTVL